MEDFDAHSQGFLKRFCAHGHGHKFLHVHGIVGMRAAIQNVHHRHGKRIAGRVARKPREIFVQRLPRSRSGRARGRHGNGEDGVRAKIPFVRRAVGFDHAVVDRSLVGGIEASYRAGNLAIHAGDGLAHALAEVARFIAIAQFDGFVLAGGRARGHCGAARCAAFEDDIRFHGRIAARIQNLPAMHPRDFRRHAAS